MVHVRLLYARVAAIATATVSAMGTALASATKAMLQVRQGPVHKRRVKVATIVTATVLAIWMVFAHAPTGGLLAQTDPAPSIMAPARLVTAAVVTGFAGMAYAAATISTLLDLPVPVTSLQSAEVTIATDMAFVMPMDPALAPTATKTAHLARALSCRLDRRDYVQEAVIAMDTVFAPTMENAFVTMASPRALAVLVRKGLLIRKILIPALLKVAVMATACATNPVIHARVGTLTHLDPTGLVLSLRNAVVTIAAGMGLVTQTGPALAKLAIAMAWAAHVR